MVAPTSPNCVFLLLFLLLLFCAPAVLGVEMTGISIILDGSSVNLSGCTWDFSELSWDDGGDWLAVSGLTVTGNPTISNPISQNFTTLSGAYSCTSFPYPSSSEQSSSAVKATMDGATDSLLVLVGFFGILVTVVVLGMVLTLFAMGKLDGQQLVVLVLMIFTTGVLCGIGILLFSALGGMG